MIEQKAQVKPISISMWGRYNCFVSDKFTVPMREEIARLFQDSLNSSCTHSANVESIGINIILSENTISKTPYIGRVCSSNKLVGAGIELKWIIAKDTDEQSVRMMMGKPMLGLLRGTFKSFGVPDEAFLKSLSKYPGWNEVIDSLSAPDLEHYASCASLIPISMDEEGFWTLIEKSKQSSTSNNEQYECLRTELSKLPAEDIAVFNEIFSSKMAEIYRYDLWAIAYIINGGCSDDGFTYFRSWLVCQGRKYYKNAIARPEFVGEQVPVEAMESKSPNNTIYEFDLLPITVYKEKTGYEMYIEYSGIGDALGYSWTYEELPSLYPSVCEKFGY